MIAAYEWLMEETKGGALVLCPSQDDGWHGRRGDRAARHSGSTGGQAASATPQFNGDRALARGRQPCGGSLPPQFTRELEYSFEISLTSLRFRVLIWLIRLIFF